MESTHWYVKLDGESIGPLTKAELRDLIRGGSIGPRTAVSPNQLDWTPAARVQGLNFSPSPPRIHPIGPRQLYFAQRNLMWKLGALCAAGLFAIFILVLASTSSEQPPVQASTRGSSPPPQLQAANQTYQYWRRVSGHLKAASAARAGVSGFRSAAASVDGLPTAGVDPDAVNCALGFSALLKECADLVESENDPSTTADELLRAFYGGWSGDFQPLVRELEGRSDARKALASHVKTVEQQLIQTRAILSSRYGVEFPAL